MHLEVALIDRLSVIVCDKLTPTLSPQSLLLNPVCLSTDRIQELIHKHCICPEKSPMPWLWAAHASSASVWSQLPLPRLAAPSRQQDHTGCLSCPNPHSDAQPHSS